MYEEDNSKRNAALIGLGVFLLIALVAIFFLKARKPESVPAPKALRPYTAPDKSFICKVPQEWRRQETGGMGIMSGVKVEKASAQIDIMSDLQGSLMGDMARAQNAQVESIEGMAPPGMNLPRMEKPRPPVEQIHQSDADKVRGDLENFQEGPMREFPSPLGDARVTEWTGEQKGMLGAVNKIHGYRVTILGNERRVSVVSRCNEADWPKLKQAFQTVTMSLAPGGG